MAHELQAAGDPQPADSMPTDGGDQAGDLAQLWEIETTDGVVSRPAWQLRPTGASRRAHARRPAAHQTKTK